MREFANRPPNGPAPGAGSGRSPAAVSEDGARRAPIAADEARLARRDPAALPAASGGAPLDAEARRILEERFEGDFAGVRVHDDAHAAQSAAALEARAFTHGQNIFFGAGTYRPHTTAGRRLLAHELAHVRQQSLTGGAPLGIEGMEGAGGPLERQAEAAAHALDWGAERDRYGDVASEVVWHSERAPRPHLLPWPERAGHRVQRLQLTYDDGPDSAGNTRRVLDALNAAGARATFYLVGRRVVQGDNWRVVFDIAAAGHWIGNHAYDWNDATDNHVFLHGTAEDRARRLLQTEWAIRDALIRGRADARKRNAWTTIPQASRDYVDDVIARGTGRFRTPGFQSHFWTTSGSTTRAAIFSANQVMAAAGLRPFAIEQITSWGITREGVNVDPEDWRAGRTQAHVEADVIGKLSKPSDTILLHSRVSASAAATPAIAAEIGRRGWSYDPTSRGASLPLPRPPFAGLKTISDPPTSAELVAARAFFRRCVPLGGMIAGSVAIGIFQLAQRAGPGEVDAFIAEIRGTRVQTPEGPLPLANYMEANPEWRLFVGFFENWRTQKPFPRIKGVTT